MKRKISVLGCGWLGFSLAIYLEKHGFEVNGSTTSKEKLPKLKSRNIGPFIIDLSKSSTDFADFLDIEVLIICIPSKVIKDFNFLLHAIEKSTLDKVLFISSTSVYPDINQTVTETTEVNDSSLSKIERLFLNNSNFQSTVIRFGGLFGYDRKPGNFIKKNKLIKQPDGFVNLIHRDDCIQIILEIIKKDFWNQTYNACADTHPNRRAFYKKSRDTLGLAEPVFDESTQNLFKIVNSDKLKNHLNYSFKYSDLIRDYF